MLDKWFMKYGDVAALVVFILSVLVMILFPLHHAHGQQCAAQPNQDIYTTMHVGENGIVTVRFDADASNNEPYDVEEVQVALSCIAFRDCLYDENNQDHAMLLYGGDGQLQNVDCGAGGGHWHSDDPFGGAAGTVIFRPDFFTQILPGHTCTFQYAVHVDGFGLPPRAVVTNEIEQVGSCAGSFENYSAGESQDGYITEPLPTPAPVCSQVRARRIVR